MAPLAILNSYVLTVDAKRVYELEPKNYPKLPSTMYEDFIISF